MLFLGQLRFSCGLPFILLIWYIRLIVFLAVKPSFDFWDKSYLVMLINPLCVAGFGLLIFSGFFVSIFVNDIGL